MDIRNSTFEDLQRIVEIYAGAKKYMAEIGNPRQWIDGYPSRELIKDDIAKKSGYVCLDEGKIVAVFYFRIENEPTYARLDRGRWLNDEPYGVIHRIAVDSRRNGIATFCLEWCFAQIGNIRIDTHKDNSAMRKVLLKNNYTYCGIVYMDDGTERLAFQKCSRA